MKGSRRSDTGSALTMWPCTGHCPGLRFLICEMGLILDLVTGIASTLHVQMLREQDLAHPGYPGVTLITGRIQCGHRGQGWSSLYPCQELHEMSEGPQGPLPSETLNSLREHLSCCVEEADSL